MIPNYLVDIEAPNAWYLDKFVIEAMEIKAVWLLMLQKHSIDVDDNIAKCDLKILILISILQSVASQYWYCY